MEQKTITHHDLNQFTGDVIRYRHWLVRRVIYTPGVKFLADAAGALWLIDVIAAYFAMDEMAEAISRDSRLKDMQFWRLDVHADGSAIVTARADSGVEPFIRRAVSYTDFPLDHVDIWAGYDGLHWTLYLPSEH